MSKNQGQLIGEGSFGKVYKIKDNSGKIWAVKEMKCAQEQQGIPASALRQITILKSLKGHPNIVEMGQIGFLQPGKSDIKVFFKYCEQDLKRYIRQYEGQLPFPIIRRIMRELLLGIMFLHHKRVIHRDLKPQNILLTQNKSVQIADFGLARIILPTQKTLTREVQTLYYRAPEIMMGERHYDFGIDIWATGCILAELFLKRPLFLGGSCEIEQILKVFQVRGTPNQEQWPKFRILQFSSSKFPKWKKQPLEGIIKNMPKQGIDLLQKMLQYDPLKRITAENALKHVFFCQ